MIKQNKKNLVKYLKLSKFVQNDNVNIKMGEKFEKNILN